MKRSELLNKSQEEVSAEERLDQIQRDKLQVQSDILETKSKVSSLKRKVVQLKSVAVLSPSDVIEAMTELQGFKAGLAALEALEKELF